MSFSYVIGIDEVGRGPLAGPVTICAFAMPYNLYLKRYAGLRKLAGTEGFRRLQDSKAMKAIDREAGSDLLFALQKNKIHNIFISISSKSANNIDKLGISTCIKMLVSHTLNKLIKEIKCKEGRVLVLLDGSLKAPPVFIHQKTIIKGDAQEKVISCASILAKVHRDKIMIKKNMKYPLYKFDLHKGYGTLLHRNLISKHGLSGLHRKSFCKRII